AGRPPEPAASARAPHCRAASARRQNRRFRAAAAAHGAILEPARFGRYALRSDRRGAGGVGNGFAHPYVDAMRRMILALTAFALLAPGLSHAQSGQPSYWIIKPEPGRAQDLPEPWLAPKYKSPRGARQHV